MKIQSIIFLLIISSSLLAQSDTWEPPYIGSSSDVLYLPDAHAVYWRYGWQREVNDQKCMVVKGTFPNARYFSYNVYDDDTKMSLGSFTDLNLKPDRNGINPFTGVADEKLSTYTIYIVPKGSQIKADNVLYFPDSVIHVSFILRHYVPEKDIYGNVPMPIVTSYDTSTKQLSAAAPSVPTPKLSKQEIKQYLIPLVQEFKQKFEDDPNALVASLHHALEKKPLKIDELICRQVASGAFKHFHPGQMNQSFNFNTSGTYPNHDNYYLTMPIIRKNDDQVLLVKFKAPEYPKSINEYPQADLRYFSLSQGDDITYNYATVMDKEMLVNPDGFIYFLIGNDSPKLRKKAKSLKVNFMPWLVQEKMLLIYRHMTPRSDYEHGINRVATFNKNKPEKGQEGSAFIGDYALIGTMMTDKQILNAKAIPSIKKLN